VEPIKIAVTDHNAVGPDGDDEFDRPIEEPTLEPAELKIDQPAVEKEIKEKAPKSAPVATKGRLFLFKYVTTLVTGLVLLALITLAGYALFDHWLGDAAKANMFSEWVYRYQLYLVVSLVLFGGLHVWMQLLTGKVASDDQPPAAKVFLAIFLTILALTVLGSVATLVYVVADTLLGTASYSVKSLWHISLDALQVTALATLLWWYFKQTRVRWAAWYAAIAGLLVAVVAGLLIAFPILNQRDAVIDSRTSNDLSAISTQISNYAQKNSKLPAALRDLKLDDAVASRVGSYEYEVTQAQTQKKSTFDLDSLYRIGGGSSSSSAALSYKLCATFKTDTTKADKDVSPIVPLFGGSSQWTRHPSGRHCFDQTVYGNSGDGSPRLTEPSDDDTLQSSLETL
jgi:competence protein ComGC